MSDGLTLIGVVLAAAALLLVVRARHRSYAAEQLRLADEEVCPHLRPAWELLKSRGHRARRVGQRHPDLPLEIHVEPPFDPQLLQSELKLDDPVFISARSVLYCKDDWCELHPAA
jgi:hypothetical protein